MTRRAMDTAEDVNVRLEELIRALRWHASSMLEHGGSTTDEGELTKVMPAINETRRAALAYVEAVFKHTGWGNVFASLYDDGPVLLRARRFWRVRADV